MLATRPRPRSEASHSPDSPAEMIAFQPAMEMPSRLQAISSQRTTGAASSALIRSCVDICASPDTPPDQLVAEIYAMVIGMLHDVRFLRDPQAVPRTEASWARLLKSYQPCAA